MIYWLPISMLLITTLTGCTHEVLMSPQREEALQAKVLDVDEKILFHRGGSWFFTGKDKQCISSQGAEVVLTDKRIILINTCNHINHLGSVLKWRYEDCTSSNLYPVSPSWTV